MHYSLSNSLGRVRNLGFNPLSLSPALWLDASDAATLYDSTVGGSLVAPDGTVARWEDKSGNGRHATQSTGVSQPLRKTAIQNGKDVVRFDGANDFISLSNFLSGNTTAFAVLKASADPPTTPADGALFQAWGTSGTNSHVPLSAGFGGGIYTDFGRNARINNISQGVVDFAAWHSQYFVSASSWQMRVNGSVLHTEGSNTPAWTATPSLCGTSGGSFWISADVAEILIFPTALSDADRQKVENYLNAKWNLY